MWPKMLLELLPHFSRLIPMADKYLSSRSASEKAQEAALAALAGEVRGELGKVTGELAEANSGLSRQLQEQGAQIAEMGVEVTRTRMGVESVEARVVKLEKSLGSALMVIWVSVGMLGIALVLLAFLLVRGLH